MASAAHRPPSSRKQGWRWARWYSGLCAVGLLWSTASSAQPKANPEPPPDETGSETLSVRAALSNRARDRLGDQRVLRLLELELDEGAPLSASPVGPLGGDIIQIWIDTPTSEIVLIEARRTNRPLLRRRITIGKSTPNIAARVVAIAASEMVQAQAKPEQLLSEEPNLEPAGPDQAAQRWANLATSAAFSTLWIPASSPTWLYGPEFSLAQRQGATEQQLYGRWLVASHTTPAMRWFEVGAGASVRVLIPETDWRVHLGARAGALFLALPEAVRIDGVGTQQAWSARGAGVLGIEHRVTQNSWLELSAEPGALLRSLQAERASGETWGVEGFALNVNLGLHVEMLLAADSSRADDGSTKPTSRTP